MFWKRDVILAQEYLGFLLLNMFDLFLTGWIFKHSGEEANGLALWVLNEFGKSGFAVYKFIMVLVLIVVCEIIAAQNVQRARMVILGGCALYLAVVIWECFLIFSYIDRPQPPPVQGMPGNALLIGPPPRPRPAFTPHWIA
jgi:hypothetical protein